MKKALFCLLFLACLLIIACFTVQWQHAVKDRKTVAMGLKGADSDIIDRHLWISDHSPETPVNSNYVPIHIVFRKNQSDSWLMMGSGTLLTKFPNHFVSAYHVFAGQPGHYGCRLVSKKELIGEEKVVPIVKLGSGTNGDDSIIGKIDPSGTDFPRIDVPESESVFKEFTDGIFHGESYPAKIHLLTYPEKTIKGAFWIEVKPGTRYIFFQWDVKPGESGTGGIVEHEPPGYFLVAIRHVLVDDKALMKKLGMPNNIYYGVGHLIKIQ